MTSVVSTASCSRRGRVATSSGVAMRSTVASSSPCCFAPAKRRFLQSPQSTTRALRIRAVSLTGCSTTSEGPRRAVEAVEGCEELGLVVEDALTAFRRGDPHESSSGSESTARTRASASNTATAVVSVASCGPAEERLHGVHLLVGEAVGIEHELLREAERGGVRIRLGVGCRRGRTTADHRGDASSA